MSTLILIKVLGFTKEVVEGTKRIWPCSIAHGFSSMTVTKLIGYFGQVREGQLSRVRAFSYNQVDDVVLVEVVHVIVA